VDLDGPRQIASVNEEPNLPGGRTGPIHLGIIMDGNRRWAAGRGLPNALGHVRGEVRLFEAIDAALAAGVPWVTVFAFSTENLSRNASEVGAILAIIRLAMRRNMRRLHRRGVQIRWLGSDVGMPADLVDELSAAQHLTADNDKMIFTICVNHGGRQHVVSAIRSLSHQIAARAITPDDVSVDSVRAHMQWSDLPDVDLLIRTSGEMRLSNFLLWHVGSAAVYFPPTLWPDFTDQDLVDIIEHYRLTSRPR
jgi:undecaprenyl diphosphate synthase